MLILNPIATALYLVHLGINIAAFFLLVRLILAWKHYAWLAHLDKVGRPLVDAMVNAVGDSVERRWGKSLAIRGRLLVSLSILLLADLILVYLINACL